MPRFARSSPPPCPDGSAERLSELLARRASGVTGERVSLGDIAGLLGDRSVPALLLVFALPVVLPIPVPGLSTALALPILLLAVQVALRRRRAWLPPALARRSIDRRAFETILGHALPLLRRLEGAVRPRARWLAGDWMTAPVGLVCALLAVAIAVPNPVGHVVPSAAVAVLALGLIERDGLVVALGLAGAVLGLVLAVVVAAEAGDAAFHWWRSSR